ncbi:MAG: heparan-alpha-glucosaminide N-acetyltransferase domain-containing protein [Ignavibacteriales bacterium]|nr:heparan-alpha-glucosaminide N-acetyltransferase domain-containing protein [Ignavibacteriales bacterium]
MKKNRIIFIDLMRAIAVLMMVQGHTIDTFLADSYRSYDSSIFNFWNFLRGLTAPIFLFSAGTVFTYLLHFNKLPFKENPRIRKGIKRFFLLIGLGYLMRWPTPYLFYFGDVTSIQWQVFFTVDVLHLIAFGLLFTIGLTFLAEKFKVRGSFIYATTAFIIFAIYPIIMKIEWKNFLPFPIAAYFYQGTGSLFPLIPWVGFVLAGAMLGHYLENNPGVFKSTRFSLNLFAIGISFIALSLIGDRLEFLLYKESAFWTTSPNLIFFRLGVVLLLNSLVSYLAIRLETIPSLFIQIGRNTLPVYVIHLVILYGSPWSLGLYNILAKRLDLWTTIAAAILMVSLMIALVQSFQVVKGYYRKKKLVTEKI